MIVKTKKYKLETKTYIWLAFKNILVDLWWVWLIPAAILIGSFFIEGALGWGIGISITLIVLYILFWLIQFTGITQMEQNKILFEKLSYEIDSRQILIKLNSKQGMPVTWDKIQKVKQGKDEYLFILSKAQFIHLPYKIFKSDNEVKFIETILKRKNFL
ncbi:YcxB family protein [Flexithrix dorotheae]|uniref:YcxB family protein n=1 Tax=Flexithrix dorotheae TaxID=70993 RepID=UPI0003700351|nr:YcxB family protein [Flexithrix dorotheae]